MGISDRLQHAWNAFMNRDPTFAYPNIGTSYSVRPDRPRFTRGNERSIVTSVYNRIALDVSAINIQHVRLDDNGRFKEQLDTPLNQCLTLSANTDQTGRAFIQDAVMSMLDEGCVAIVPIETSIDPTVSDSYEIYTMRTAKIVEWYPKHVKIRAYNELIGQQEEKIVPKKTVAII